MEVTRFDSNLGIDGFEVVNIAIAFIKDKVESESLKQFKEEYNNLLICEADSRRKKASALIMQMAKLKIALSKFEATYSSIISKTGKIESIEKYISSIKLLIKQLSLEKNKHLIVS